MHILWDFEDVEGHKALEPLTNNYFLSVVFFSILAFVLDPLRASPAPASVRMLSPTPLLVLGVGLSLRLELTGILLLLPV